MLGMPPQGSSATPSQRNFGLPASFTLVIDWAVQPHRALFLTRPSKDELLAIAPQISGGRCAAGIERRIGVLNRRQYRPPRIGYRKAQFSRNFSPAADYYIADWIEARTLSEQSTALVFVLANGGNVYLNGERVDIIVDLAA
jgi:hypothetical protein